MIIKEQTFISSEAIQNNLKRLTNQIYKLLPSWEEAIDWEGPLESIIEEFFGMNRLFLDHHTILFSLLCKLEGLFRYSNEEDFLKFRKTIFECLNLLEQLKALC